MDIENIIDRLKNERYRTSTKKSYRSVWKNFNRFFIRLDVKPSNWEDRVSLYTGYLIGCKKQSSMVKSYNLAIKVVLCDIGIELDLDRCLITSLTKACQMVNDSVRTRLPIKKAILNSLLKGVQRHSAEQPYLMKLYLAIFSTAYFGLFRVGEITRSPHVV